VDRGGIVTPIMAATPWTSNAALIADCAALGYLRSDWLTLDPTYGKGNWWTKWQPDRLVTSDLSPSLSTTDLQADFTYLPFQAATFDAVTYDPPYVCVGGRRTSGIESMYDAYGLIRAPSTPADLQALIDAGLAECERVLRSGGMLLVKCQSYVSSGKLWPGVYYTQQWANVLDLELVDMLQHISGPRPQPGGRRQVHARNNYSTLLVLRKGQ